MGFPATSLVVLIGIDRRGLVECPSSVDFSPCGPLEMYSFHWKEQTTYGSTLGFSPRPAEIVIDSLPFGSPATAFLKLSFLRLFAPSSVLDGDVRVEGDCAREAVVEECERGVCGGVA